MKTAGDITHGLFRLDLERQVERAEAPRAPRGRTLVEVMHTMLRGEEPELPATITRAKPGGEEDENGETLSDPKIDHVAPDLA